MLYKINVIYEDRVIISYKTPIIPLHNEKIYLSQGEFTVIELGHIVCCKENDSVLCELDIYVS